VTGDFFRGKMARKKDPELFEFFLPGAFCSPLLYSKVQKIEVKTYKSFAFPMSLDHPASD
jgi:hypothetical protein